VIYHLWLQKKIKQVKGKENVNFNGYDKEKRERVSHD
jgi:hypothetical protein